MSEYATAVVAYRDGIVVAVDLDGTKECIDDYLARGLTVRWETPTRAKELIIKTVETKAKGFKE